MLLFQILFYFIFWNIIAWILIHPKRILLSFFRQKFFVFKNFRQKHFKMTEISDRDFWGWHFVFLFLRNDKNVIEMERNGHRDREREKEGEKEKMRERERRKKSERIIITADAVRFEFEIWGIPEAENSIRVFVREREISSTLSISLHHSIILSIITMIGHPFFLFLLEETTLKCNRKLNRSECFITP